MKIETYQQKYKGTTRTIYRAYIDGGYIEAGSKEKLEELINNHVPINEGTFRTE